jgi:DNA (cytosine-5)-methyltransferase 1
VKVVDLFCGCGGFSLGAHAAGLGPSLAFDIDSILTSSFGRNFPTTHLVKQNIATICGADIEREIGGRVDGVFGGPPCQAFSAIGRRRTNDPRRELVYHFFRIVSELKPIFFVMENVRGLSYPNARPLLESCVALVGDHYTILGPTVLDAAEFGAATRRPRLFIIGYDRERCDAITLSDLELKKSKPATVFEAISDLEFGELIGEQDGFDLWKIRRKGRPNKFAQYLRSSDATFTGHKQTNHTKEVVKRFRTIVAGTNDLIGRHPRLEWDGQCPTLRAGTGNDLGSYQSVRPIHPREPRVITVREAARLQGFPDKFRFHPTIWHSFRMIGNSVSPIISEAIFRIIAEKTGAAASNFSIAAE